MRTEDFRLLGGAELIRRFEAPVRETPPGYRTAFCSRCGSPVPDPRPGADWFEVPAGLFDDDPRIRPDRHIYVECKSAWHTIADTLPQLDAAALAALRRAMGGRRW